MFKIYFVNKIIFILFSRLFKIYEKIKIVKEKQEKYFIFTHSILSIKKRKDCEKYIDIGV